MRTRFVLASVVCLTLAACGQSNPDSPNHNLKGNGSAATPQSPAKPLGLKEIRGFTVGGPLNFGNLTVFPVLSKTEQKADRFITLDEGLKAGTVEVVEVGATAPISQAVQQPGLMAQAGPTGSPAVQIINAPGSRQTAIQASSHRLTGNQVNQLMVINRSGKPLYLMPGEVIVGGSQDRTIGSEMAIAPTGRPVPIDVFCVEHGRWSQRNQSMASGLLHSIGAAPTAAAAQTLAAESNRGKFVATAGSLSKSVRLAVQSGEGQQAVWDNVAKANAKTKATSDSGTFVSNYSKKEVVDKLQPFQKALADPVAHNERVVGVVVAVNGKIESVDVFESTPLFRKLWPKLLKSYALDAITVAEGKNTPTSASAAGASAFLEKVLEGESRGTKQSAGGLVVTRRETKDCVSYSAAAPAALDEKRAPGSIVHTAAYAR